MEASGQPSSHPLVLLVLAVLAAAPVAAAPESASPGTDATTFRVGWLLELDNLNPFIGLLGRD